MIPVGVLFVINQLNAAGKEAFLVGGCVRDALMGIKPHDYDVCSSARPEEVTELFSSFPLVMAGVKHGTVGVLTDTGLVEITTYRRETAYTDHRHPDAVWFVTGLEEDLARRDFSINAMAMAASGEITDYFGGREDIQKKIIRCVGRSETRFEEDALRILRALRFASRLGFTLAPETAAAAHTCGGMLTDIAAERCWEELKGILQGNCAAAVVNEFLDIIRVVIPEARSLREDIPLDLSLRLACLLPNAEEDFLRRLRCEKKRMREIREIQTLSCPRNITDTWALSARYGEERTRQVLQYHGLPTDNLRAVMSQSPCPEAAQLAITGTDLRSIGLSGRSIGELLSHLLTAVLERKVPNEKTALISFARGLVEERKM